MKRWNPHNLLLSVFIILLALFLWPEDVRAQLSITIGSGTTVTAGSDSQIHISGDWTNNGIFTAGNGVVIFDSATTQMITNPTGETFHNLTVNKASGDLVLNNNATIKETLTLTNGNILTGTNTLRLGTTSEGTLSRANGTIIGNFARYIGTSAGARLFPVGVSSNHRPLTIEYTIPPTTGGILTVSHTSPGGDFAELTTSLDDAGYTIDRRSTMFWTITTASINGGKYDLNVEANGQVGINNPPLLRMIYSLDGSNFRLVGTHSQGTGTTVKRTGIDGSIFGQFYLGGNKFDNPLGTDVPLRTVEVSLLSVSIEQTADEALLEFKLNNASNIANFDAVFAYEKAVLSNPEVTKSNTIASFQMEANTDTPGRIAVAAFSPDAIPAGMQNVVLFTLRFRIVSGFSGETTVRITELLLNDANFKPVTATKKDGVITVRPPEVMVTTVLRFSSAPQTLFEGTVSDPITIETRDANGNPATSASAVTVKLSSTSTTGRFDTAANGTFNGTVTSVTIPAGATSATVFYKDTKIGTATLTAIATGLTSGTQPVTVTSTVTSVLVVEGVIRNPDGSPAEVGLRVTVTVGNNPPQTMSSTANGNYTVTFVDLLGIVAKIGDTVTVSVSRATTGESAVSTVVLTSQQIMNQTVTVGVTFRGKPCFDLTIPQGISLIHIPLKVTQVDGKALEIKTIGDLYAVFGGSANVNFIITRDAAAGVWQSYLGEQNRRAAADRTLTDDMGIITVMKNPMTLRLKGDALGVDGKAQIHLQRGTNLVGVPLWSASLKRVSDLLSLAGIKGNVTAMIVSDAGTFKVVSLPGDPGDIALTGGQSFIITARQAGVADITGVAWDNVSSPASAAPPMAFVGHTIDEVTPVLAVHGAVVDEITGLVKGGFRVIVKNLSTGASFSTLSDSDTPLDSYSTTFVDAISSRAARVGDILEIAVESPSPLIGVQPLRHIVSPDDVKASQIQLPDFVAYRIPTETKLLPNYPNPFNPETWIPYRLAKDASVTLTIYDTTGAVVRTLQVGHKPAAAYESKGKAIYWDGRNDFGERVASGVYFYTLTAKDFTATRKMLILK